MIILIFLHYMFGENNLNDHSVDLIIGTVCCNIHSTLPIELAFDVSLWLIFLLVLFLALGISSAPCL